jgi:hypothetical protein
MRLEAIIGGPGDPSGAVEDLLETIFPASLVPTLERHGMATGAEIDVDTLVTRMRDEITALDSVVIGRSEIWCLEPATGQSRVAVSLQVGRSGC